jgi:creatinine amidohydrolase
MSGDALQLERMSWPEVEAALHAGMTTAVIPCGAVEQHGPHLPLFVDAEHGTRLGEEVAWRLGNALVAPTIRVGCSEHHLAFPGTISLSEGTFYAVCQDYCTSLASHGFRYICLLPSHGGNCRPLANMVEELDARMGSGCRVVAFTDLLRMVEVWKRVVDEESGLGNRVGGHADIAESSVMLCLHPDLVHQEAAEAGHPPAISAAFIDRILRDGLRSVTPNGILGDARGMSLRIGARCIEAMADLMAGFFKRAEGAAQWPEGEP